MKQRSFWCKHFWSLSLLLRDIPKHWQFIAASLIVRWSNIHETLTISFYRLMSTNVFVFIVLLCETLIFHCCCGDVLLTLLLVPLMKQRWFWMQTISIFYVFNVLVSEKLMFHCCFNDDSLVTFWWNIDEKWRLRWKQYWLVRILLCLSFISWDFIAAWFFIRWWVFEQTSMTHWWFWFKL